MSMTISSTSGVSGVTTDWWDFDILIPDANGGNLMIVGQILASGGTVQNVTNTLAMPTAPGSGTIWVSVQVDVTTGAATLQQSTVSDPVPINGNNVVVYRTQLTVTTTDPMLVAAQSTPDAQ